MLLFTISRSHFRVTRAPFRFVTRPFTVQNVNAAIKLPPRPVLNEDDIEENFIRGSGPGGQKINKSATAVQLKHLPSGIVVKSQKTRSRSQNRKIARTLLAEKIDAAEKGPESRMALKAEVARKKKAKKNKKAKRKYQALQSRTEDGTDEEGEAELSGDKTIEEKVIEERV